MKLVFAVALVALSSLALPAVAKPCDDNASEAMRRPGGFCEILRDGSSLSTPPQSNQAAAKEQMESQEPPSIFAPGQTPTI